MTLPFDVHPPFGPNTRSAHSCLSAPSEDVLPCVGSIVSTGGPAPAFASVPALYPAFAPFPVVVAAVDRVSGDPALASVVASDVPVAGADSQPAVEPFALVAGAFVRVFSVPAPVVVAAFLVPVVVSALTQ